ncbi:MAG: metal ABC transporter permease [Clostridia bacterium]|nr:metal ABC transporter permease [Clostridia bacterium]
MSITDIFSNHMILVMFLSSIGIGVLISFCASLLGVTLVLKKYSMLGDGLAHIGFGSMAIAALCEKIFAKDLGAYSMLISVPLVIAAAILILKLSEHSALKGDSAIAVISTGALALGYIIFEYATGNTTDVCSSMFGSADLLTPSVADIITTVCLAAAVLVIFILFYNRIFAVTFDETFSKASGIKTDRFKTVIAILSALTVVMGMKMLGAVMISGLVVFPALSAMRLCKTFKTVVIGSVVISTVCTTLGILSAFLISGLPIGPTVVLINLVLYSVLSLSSKLKKA